MISIKNLCYIASSAPMLLATMPSASAEDKLIVATAATAHGSRLPQSLVSRPEIFKKHGLVLEFMFTRDNAETEQRVISGSADIGSAVSAMEVMRSYSFGAHLRILAHI